MRGALLFTLVRCHKAQTIRTFGFQRGQRSVDGTIIRGNAQQPKNDTYILRLFIASEMMRFCVESWYFFYHVSKKLCTSNFGLTIKSLFAPNRLNQITTFITRLLVYLKFLIIFSQLRISKNISINRKEIILLFMLSGVQFGPCAKKN
jgi:hypothetical protein